MPRIITNTPGQETLDANLVALNLAVESLLYEVDLSPGDFPVIAQGSPTWKPLSQRGTVINMPKAATSGVQATIKIPSEWRNGKIYYKVFYSGDTADGVNNIKFSIRFSAFGEGDDLRSPALTGDQTRGYTSPSSTDERLSERAPNSILTLTADYDEMDVLVRRLASDDYAGEVYFRRIVVIFAPNKGG